MKMSDSITCFRICYFLISCYLLLCSRWHKKEFEGISVNTEVSNFYIEEDVRGRALRASES